MAQERDPARRNPAGVAGVLAPEAEHALDAHAEPLTGVVAEIARDEARLVAVEAGRDGCVGREEVAGTRHAERGLEVDTGLLHEEARPLEHGERGMPFVQVTDLGIDPEAAQQAPAADAEHDLLLESQPAVAAVELARDAAVGGGIHRIVAVEQQQAHAAHAHLPGAEPETAPARAEIDPHPLTALVAKRHHRKLCGVVVGVELLLSAVGVEHLPEVALRVEQAHADHRDAEIARALELVPGHVAETAGVDRQRFGEPELHAEIGHHAELLTGVGALQPARCVELGLIRAHRRLDAPQADGIARHLGEGGARGDLEHQPGDARRGPPG